MFRWTAPLRGPRGHCQAAVTVGHNLYCFRGFDLNGPSSQISVYVLSTVALCWVRLPPVTTGKQGECPPEVPYMCTGHTAVLVEGIVYVWGDELTHGNQLYAFDADAHRWLKTEVSGTVPEARTGHSACVLGKVMYVHGGCIRLRMVECKNDTYKLDTTTMVWSVIHTRGTPPHASSQHSATIIGTKMYVLGGWTQQVRNTNIRVLDTETNCWLGIRPPPGQFHPAQLSDHAAFAYDGELYVFCGNETRYSSPNKGLWKFNTKTFAWKKVESKGKGPSKVSRCCTVGDRVILFDTDLYVLDLSPSMKTLCKLAVIQYGLEESELPHDLRWQLAAMMSGGNWHKVATGRCKLASGGNWKQVGAKSKWEMEGGGEWQRVRKASYEVRWKP